MLLRTKILAILSLLIIPTSLGASTILLTPNGEEIWTENTMQRITWDPSRLSGEINLVYRNEYGNEYGIIATDVPSSDGEYEWEIPYGIVRSEDGLVKVQIRKGYCLKKENVIDESDSYFAIRKNTEGSHENSRVNNHMYAEAITYLRRMGLLDEYMQSFNHPDTKMNRAGFSWISANAFLDLANIKSCTKRYFPDIPEHAWYERHVCAIRRQGLIDGDADGNFRPATMIQLAEAARTIATHYNLVDTITKKDSDGSLRYDPYLRGLAESKAIPTSIQYIDQRISRGELAEMIYRLEEGITTKPYRKYDELSFGNVVDEDPTFDRIPLHSKALRKGERNTVYAYSVTAPTDGSITYRSQWWQLSGYPGGVQWSQPQLDFYSDSARSRKLASWTSDDNWNNSSGIFFLTGAVPVTAGETLYVELSVHVESLWKCGYSLNVLHSPLGDLNVESKKCGRLSVLWRKLLSYLGKKNINSPQCP